MSTQVAHTGTFIQQPFPSRQYNRSQIPVTALRSVKGNRSAPAQKQYFAPEQEQKYTGKHHPAASILSAPHHLQSKEKGSSWQGRKRASVLCWDCKPCRRGSECRKMPQQGPPPHFQGPVISGNSNNLSIQQWLYCFSCVCFIELERQVFLPSQLAIGGAWKSNPL